MKRIILILIVLNYVIVMQSQNYSMTQKISSSENLTFSIDFFNDNTYIFSCTKHQINSDVFGIHLLSFGEYKKTNNTYILKDKFNDYQLHFHEIKEKTGKNIFLKSIAGFEWMQNNIFMLSDNKPNDTKFLIENISSPKQKKEVDLNCTQKQQFSFFSGIYKSHNIDYKIILKADRSYIIYLYNFLLSSGKWQNIGNTLILRDTFLKKEFRALISKENAIVSCFLPFEFYGRVLSSQVKEK